MTLEQIALAGFAVESLVESIKWLVEGEWSRDRIAAFVLGEIIAVITGANLFAVLNLPVASYVPEWLSVAVGVGMAGVMLMRGANYLHDILKTVQAFAPSK